MLLSIYETNKTKLDISICCSYATSLPVNLRTLSPLHRLHGDVYMIMNWKGDERMPRHSVL